MLLLLLLLLHFDCYHLAAMAAMAPFAARSLNKCYACGFSAIPEVTLFAGPGRLCLASSLLLLTTLLLRPPSLILVQGFQFFFHARKVEPKGHPELGAGCL